MADGDQVVRKARSAIEVAGDFLRSSVGAKVVMGLTGIGLWGFVIAHMLGNLQVFQGPDAINSYGATLQGSLHGVGVWILRSGLLAITVAHIFFGLRLAALNRAARPIEYKMRKDMRTTPMARTMTWTGLLILGFIVFHILHFTTGTILPDLFNVHETVDGEQRHDVYKMVVAAFQIPWVVAVYVIGQGILLAHLTHGTANLWQSLGLSHLVWSPALKVIGRATAAVIFAGNIAIPLAILLFWK
ncbi:MAG: succinate dehydrogenase cytochrome b subunit [Deltaproteobacteria bacterium]|nr:succinate dehydrogenase cytochrome b subunit [Deltaproteobacteria bacterium]